MREPDCASPPFFPVLSSWPEGFSGGVAFDGSIMTHLFRAQAADGRIDTVVRHRGHSERSGLWKCAVQAVPLR
jgi:hypothetical protein